jgi:hypothetical protein
MMMQQQVLQSPNRGIYNQPNCLLPKSFFQGRSVPNFHPESLDHEQWWSQQTTYMRDGFTDGGYSVTGAYYYHLNFKKINMLDHLKNPFIGHPYYSEEDQQLFADVEKARSQGKGIILITGRGFGKSFNATTIVEHKFVVYPASECIVSASTDFFAKNLWNKIDIGLNNLPDDLRPNMLVDTKDEKESGYEIVENGKKKKVGFRSKIHRITYDNDEGRTRGTRPDIHVFEEIGSWTGKAKLIQCYNATSPSWKRGSYSTCFPLLIGTGGQMKTGGSQDAETMFWNPEAYGLMAFSYNGEPWFEKKCGRFFAAYEKCEGFYEDSGRSDKNAARAYHDNERETKKADLGVYLQHTMEFPYDPYEAFRVDGSGIFDRVLLETQHQRIQRNEELKKLVQRGNLKWINPNNPLAGVRWEADPNGIIEILEHPEWVIDRAVEKFPFLYVSGCDSYDAVEEESKGPDSRSKGSIFIYKRFWTPNRTGNVYVAKCTIRMKNATNFYWETVKLNLYYNSRMLYEHTNKGISQHYIMHKLHAYLHPRPKLEEVSVMKKTVSTNRYGLTMPEEVKIHCIKRYADYIEKFSEDMYFVSQIEDALKFVFGSSKHDETMAASIAKVADDDLHHIVLEQHKKQIMHYPTFTTLNGITQFR